MASEPEDLNTKYEETSTIDTESDINTTDINAQQSLDTNEYDNDPNLQIIQPNQLIKHTTSRDKLIPSINYSPSPQPIATTTISPSKSSNIDTTITSNSNNQMKP